MNGHLGARRPVPRATERVAHEFIDDSLHRREIDGRAIKAEFRILMRRHSDGDTLLHGEAHAEGVHPGCVGVWNNFKNTRNVAGGKCVFCLSQCVRLALLVQ